MRVIAIEKMFAASGCEDESSGQVPKLDLPLARREFLKGSGVLMGTLAIRQADYIAKQMSARTI